MSASRERELILAYSYWPLGRWHNGWRQPEAHNEGSVDPVYLRQQVRLAEAAHFHYFFLGDIATINPHVAERNPTFAFKLEGFALAGFLAAASDKIGIITTVNSSLEDPYNVTRRAVSLDHLSGGRIGLNIVTGAAETAYALQANYSGRGGLEPFDKYNRAEEFVSILHGLTDSWEDGWYLDDRASGRFLDPDKAHKINFSGSYFQVSGPLNLPRSVQGHLPIVHAGTSERSLDFGARHADIRFALSRDLAWNKAFYQDLKSRAEATGFDGSERLVVPGFQFFLADTAADAARLFRDIQSRRAGPYVGEDIEKYLGVVLRDSRPDTRVLDALDIGGLEKAWFVDSAFKAYGDEGIMLQDLHDFIRNNPVNQAPVVGGPKEIADWIELWFEERAFDGIKVFPPYGGDFLERFTASVVPELQRRGIFRKQRRASSLREDLGLGKRAPAPPAREARHA